MNEEIELLFTDFMIPVAFLFYNGNAADYVVYRQTDAAEVLAADDHIIAYDDYYDFDVYCKGNYLTYCEAIINILTAAGWTFCPSRCSGDLYETDTQYYHKTLCFSHERSMN